MITPTKMKKTQRRNNMTMARITLLKEDLC
jgi:hypothetical protein